MTKRWYNYRPLLIIFAFLMLGSLFAFYIQKQLVLTIIVSILTLILIIVISIIKKKAKYLLVPLISFVVALFMFDFAIYSFNKTENFKPEIVSCRVYSISSVEQGVLSIKADNCKFDNKNINSNLIVYIYDNNGLFSNIDIGSMLEFKPLNLYKTDIYYNKTLNASAYKQKLRFSITTKIDDLVVVGKDKTLGEKIKLKIKENLNGSLNNENVELAYSTLFGDKDFLGEEQYKAYRLSGIAHLLAVSGLHVSIIVAIISKLLGIIKIKGWSKLGVIIILLGFYAYLCNFSVSVLRAGIMAVLLMISTILGKEYDSLSSIGFAGIIAFLINPLSLFDISFLMSFACAFGIVLFRKPISELLVKMKCNKKVADAMAVTISTLVALIFISAFYFENFNLISLVSNLILIPIFTIAFSIVFVVSTISLVIPHVVYVLTPINYIFDLINVFATILGNFWFANFTTAQLNFIAIPLYFILLFMISRICVATSKNKLTISLPTVAILLLCLI